MNIEGVVVVNQKAERRIAGGHVWIFRSDVLSQRGADAGALVRVRNERGGVLGFAWWSDRSEIRLRLLVRGEDLPERWLHERIETALRWREEVAAGAEACRLVHGEGDGLPSVIVDRYRDYLVLQTLSQGAERHQAELVQLLVERLSPKGVLERNDPRVREFEGLEPRVGLLYGNVPERIEIEENGVRLAVDLWKGQKTGLFLDQRENHHAAGRYARGRVLDAFSYQGGFSLALAGTVDEVLAVDVSGPAAAALRDNAALNGLSNVTVREANAFDLLRDLERQGERFDTVILDPPAFAKNKAAIVKATRGYKEINLRALKLLAPGGRLITCSCSYHVKEGDFEALLMDAAGDAKVAVSVVEKRSQGRDHPIVLGVPETRYLKCFILRRAS